MLKRREFLEFSRKRIRASEDYWLHLSRRAMACRFEVTLPAVERAGVDIARQALDEVEKLERQLTIFRESSEVCFINRYAASRPVSVEESLFVLLVWCQDLSGETEGAFDITSGPLSRCWGFSRREGRMPELQEVEGARALVGSDKLLFDRRSGTIRFDRQGVKINLGGVGKGYALDRVAATIGGRLPSALLSAGSSSIRAIGSGDRRGDGWVVGVRHPRFKERRLAVVRIRDTSLSTSGSEEQFFEHGGRRYGHLIDPRTGLPADCVTGVTVVAESAAVTDALATAFYVGGPRLAEAYCSTHPGILVLMLENGSEHPVVFGSNDRCKVEIIHE